MNQNIRKNIIIIVAVLAIIPLTFFGVSLIGDKNNSVSNSSSSETTSSSPLIERGSFSAETFAQQRALREYESLKQDYPSNPLVGGSISPVSGGSVSYDPSLNCSAVVIKNFDPDKFNGVGKNINFFMDDGSQAIIILDSIDHIKGVQINDQYTDAYGSCSTDYGNSLSCMIRSANGGMIGGTRSNIIHIQAFTSRGAYLSR